MKKISVLIPILSLVLIVLTSYMMSIKATFDPIVGGIIIIGSIFVIIKYFEVLSKYGFID